MRFNGMLRRVVAGVSSVLAFVASGCSSPAKEVPPIQPIEAGDTVVSFRYELYEGKLSEVYFYSHHEDEYSSFSTVYLRDMGENEGIQYTTTSEPVATFTSLAIKLGLDKYPFTRLSDEKRNQDRWLIEVVYRSGKKISIVHYPSKATAEEEAAVRARCEEAFKAVPLRDAEGNLLGEYSVTFYRDGKATKVVNHAANGMVLNGHDYENPDITF